MIDNDKEKNKGDFCDRDNTEIKNMIKIRMIPR